MRAPCNLENKAKWDCLEVKDKAATTHVKGALTVVDKESYAQAVKNGPGKKVTSIKHSTVPSSGDEEGERAPIRPKVTGKSVKGKLVAMYLTHD